MNTILNIMDKLYSDSKTLSIVYVVGAILLFVFIILLMISLRKPDKKEKQKIIEEPKIEEDNNILEINEEKKEEPKEEVSNIDIENNKETEEIKPLDQSIFEKTVIIPLDEIKQEKSIEDVLTKAEEHVLEEETADNKTLENISAEIPDVDEFVDNVVKKTYEKNEQFSSVYVGDNTNTIKLDKVMENLNVDEEVKETIIPEEEKTIVKEEPVEESNEINSTGNNEAEKGEESTDKEETKTEEQETNNSLDDLKKALEEKKKEVELKQDDLKAKLESLKKNN